MEMKMKLINGDAITELKKIPTESIDCIITSPPYWKGFEYESYFHYHPTEKPVPLLKDLVLTYSDAGDTILDFTMGSGSTGVACLQTDRNFIGIELDEKYYDIAEKRCNEC